MKFTKPCVPASFRRLKNAEVDRRVREMAEIVSLTAILQKKPHDLSSGQAQAVGLARALMRQPNVLLLDEPISHQDISQRFQMRMYIKRLHIDLGYTMILVTHDQEDAMSMADRVAVMENGRLHQIATPREIYDHPANLFVAGFIGDIPMNFLPCSPRTEGGKTLLGGNCFELDVSGRFSPSALSKELVVGIRPYDLRVCDETGEIPAQVLNVEQLGDMNILLVECGGERIQIAASVQCVPARGESVRLKVNTSHVSLFDRTTAMLLPPADTAATQIKGGLL